MEKDASVHSLITLGEDGRSGCWNLRFLMDFCDWELEVMKELMDFLYSKQFFFLISNKNRINHEETAKKADTRCS